jgi:cation transport regulator ChaC
MSLTAELVARCHREEPDPGPEDGYPEFTETEYDAAAADLLRQKAPGPLWLFAYGSLIWKPEFDSVEHRRAAAPGWHRAFCMELTRWRGSPQQPGLMMGLELGGRCEGIAFRLRDEDHGAQIGRLLRREISGHDGIKAVRWIDIEIGGAMQQALVFWADTTHTDFKSRCRCRRWRIWPEPAVSARGGVSVSHREQAGGIRHPRRGSLAIAGDGGGGDQVIDRGRDGTGCALSSDLGFTFRATKNGEVFLHHRGKLATTLRGEAAAEFLADIDGADADEQQQIMARATGNYRRGNERLAKNHPRNR